ncbi:MAG: replication initiation protein [Lactococcus lactis]|jgi:hypothetical protein|nr:replication initiation protein [Prevotella sp.]MBN2936299.1 replication initiation protein [Lactococcus lactis]
MKKNKGKKSYIVQQDNRIANEKDSFKRYERNVLYQAVRALQEKYPIKKLDDGTSIHAYNTNDIRSEIVTLTETRLLECLGSKNAGKRNHLPELKAALQALAEKRCDIPESFKGKNWVYVNWISSAEYNPTTKTFEIEFSKKIIPYLLNLSGKFTQFDVYSLFELKNPYTQRFYIKCKAEKHDNYSFYMTEKEIRENFQVYTEKDGKKKPKYPNHSQFRTAVIEKAYKELKEKYEAGFCDCYFEYTEAESFSGERYPDRWYFSIGFKGHPANVNAYKEKKTTEEQHSNNPVQLSFLDSLESQAKKNQVEYSSNTEKAKQNDSNIMMIDLTLKKWFSNDPDFRGEIVNALSRMSVIKVEEVKDKILRITTNPEYRKSSQDGTVKVLRSALSKDVLKKK